MATANGKKLQKKPANVGTFDEEVAKAKAEREAEERKFDAVPVDEEYDLIAGYTDEDGNEHKTFTIRDMTGEDEEFFGRKNGMHHLKKQGLIMERLVTSIGTLRKDEMKPREWHEVIQNLYGADADCIMLHIRASAFGDVLKLNHTCTNPDCKAKIETEMSFEEFDIIEWDGEEGILFDLPTPFVDKSGNEHTSGIIKYPRQCDREVTAPLLKANGARGITVMLTRLLEFDDGYKVSEKELQKMTTRNRNYLLETFQSGQFGYDMSISIDCPECGNTFDGAVSTGEGFF